MLNYEKLIVGEMRTNCYLVWDEDKKVVIIDPGDEVEFISDEIEKRQLKPIGILLTHRHPDHTRAVLPLELIYQISILNPSPRRSRVSPFDKRETKIFDFQVIRTPGHTTDSVCFYSPLLGVVFIGDTKWREVQKRLKLPKNTVFLPGHDEDMMIEVEY